MVTVTAPRLSTLNPNKSRSNLSIASNKRRLTPLSSSEITYILEGCRDNIRLDGRTRNELRSYTLLQNSPLSLSNGSARIFMGGGATHVLCSCKADLVQPSPLYPYQGVVELHVDLLRNQQRQQQEELEMTLSNLLLTNVVDLEKLCVVPGAYVWRLGVDVLVLNGSGGSVMDACSRVIRAALGNTQLPSVTPTHKQHTVPDSSNGSSSGAQVDLAVDGDMAHAISVPGVDKCPIVVTVHVMKCPPKNTAAFVVDASLQEEACASCQVRVAVDPNSNVCALHNQGPLEAFLLSDILSTATHAAKQMFQQDAMVVKDSGQGQHTVETTTLLQDQFQFR